MANSFSHFEGCGATEQEWIGTNASPKVKEESRDQPRRVYPATEDFHLRQQILIQKDFANTKFGIFRMEAHTCAQN